MHETVPLYQRVYLTLCPAPAGRMKLGLSLLPPATGDAMAVLLSKGMLVGSKTIEVDLTREPAEDPAVKALQSARLLGVITLAQTATAAIAAGLRTIGVTVPAGMGLKAADPILVIPTVRLSGYAIHDAVTMTAPLLALNQRYELPCKLVRLSF